MQWLPDVGIRMTAQLCYDGSGLYIRQRAWEQNLRMEETEPLGSICQDSCMEFFFMPEGDDRYLNFEWNLNGCLCLGIGRGRNDRIRLVPQKPEELFAFHSETDAGGWHLEYRIPLDFLHEFYPSMELRPGLCLRANCFKCGDLTKQEHYLSWNIVTSAAPDYHRPCDFGKMVFG